MTPSQGVAPWEPYDYQERLLNDQSRRRLILKARQTGISTAIALEALYYAIHFEYDRTLFVSRNQELAGLLIRYCQVALAGLYPQVKTSSESQSKITLPNGSEIVSLPANPGTGRGYPASRLYLDEFAFQEYAELVYQGILPTLPADGQITILSTAKGRNNLYFRLWQGVEGGEWSRHTIHWSDCPRYRDDPNWETETKANMTGQAFAEEYDLDFVSAGDAVFNPDDLEMAKVGWNPDPAGCSKYIHAWDIGRRQDYSVGLTLGLRDDVWHVLSLDRFQAPYPVIQSRIEQRHRSLKGTTWVESNGVGDPVVENLVVNVQPFTMTAKTKLQAIQSLQLLLEKGRLKYGNEHLDRELGLYEWDDKNLVQDCVMAMAIAAHAAEPTGLESWAERMGKAEPLHEPAMQRPSSRSPFGKTGDEYARAGRARGYGEAW